MSDEIRREHERALGEMATKMADTYRRDVELAQLAAARGEWQKGRRTIQEQKADRVRRTLELHAAGRSAPYIARALKLDVRTVYRYLAEARTATDSRLSG